MSDKRAFEAKLDLLIEHELERASEQTSKRVRSRLNREIEADRAAVLQAYDAAPGVRTAISMGRAIQNVVDRIERITQRRHDDETFTSDVRWIRGLAKELAGHGSPPDAAAGRERQPVAVVSASEWRRAQEGRTFMAIPGSEPDSSGDVLLFTHPAPKADAAADWMLAPREPTPEMITAGRQELGLAIDACDFAACAQRTYAAMIQASPARVGDLDRIRSAMTDFIREHAGTKEAAATEFWLRQLTPVDAPKDVG